ncbi:MAG: ribonuclease Z, partial [Pseudomonadota bacterium]|nr:ribonuclease Z [Pseudomonadota bacterium]
LAAYSWNLVANYAEAMEVEAIEMLSSASARRVLFRCQNRFQPEGEGELWLDEGLLLEDPAVRVRATSLDHGVTSLGFCAEEPMHVNVWKNRLEEMNLLVGPWLGKFKDAIMAGKPDDTPIRAWRRGLNTIETPEFSLGELREQIVRIVPGQRVGYVVDVRYTEANVERIVALVKGADHLFIESPFLDEDAEQAATKNHLTARQAGTIARLAGVKALTVFHFSPRYTDRESVLRAEALAAFEGR